MPQKAVLAVLLVLVTIIFSSCSNGEITAYSPLRIDPYNPGQYGTQIYNITDWSQVIDYTGNPVTLEISLTNTGDEADYGVILFVDGVRVLFTTNEHSEPDFMQKFRLKAEEERIISLTFSPNVNTQRDTVPVNIATILNPGHRLCSLDFANYLMHHSLLQASPYHINISASTGKEILFSNIDKEENLPKELEEKFVSVGDSNDEADGTANELDNAAHFKLYRETINSAEDYYEVKRGDDLHLNLACLGKSGKYRISLYINHEIVADFDGAEYLEVDVEREKLKTKKITVPSNELEKYDEFNHIYLIAIPLEQGETVTLLKSQTKILYISN